MATRQDPKPHDRRRTHRPVTAEAAATRATEATAAPRLRPQTEVTARLIPAGDLDREVASDSVVDSQHRRTFFKAEPYFLAARRNGATLASWC
jgi:hypothetical protein